MARGLVIAAAFAAACVEDVQLGGASDGGIPGLMALEIAPAAATLSIDALDGPPQRASFRASGRFADGTERDVTELVAWSADRPHTGSIVAPGVYETSNRAAGRVEVTAASGQISATASLTVVVTQTLVDPAYPPPPGADSLFSEGTLDPARPERAPIVAYPAHETVIPSDLAPILFQWEPGDPTNDAWRITFESDVLHLAVLTSADRWQPTSELWTLIAASHTGESVRVVVTGGATSDPASIYASAPVDLVVSAAAAAGVITFRTSDGDALVSAAPSSTVATRVYPTPPDTSCVSCHTVSRDGTAIAMGYGGESLRVIDVPSAAVLAPMPPRGMGWAAFSPDGSALLVADKGKLTLLDARTGEPIGPGEGEVPLASGLRATHPDWSPAGDAVLLSFGSTVGNRDMKGGSIGLLPFVDGVWGEPEMLVVSTGDDDNNFFPRFSPDGKWIAYVHAESASRGAPTAELRLISVDGGAPIVLARASGTGLGSTMPSFSPDGAWLAFTTSRPYGRVAPLGEVDRIWIAAIDLSRADEGGDPSSPAFWLPAQASSSMQYLPVWRVQTPHDPL